MIVCCEYFEDEGESIKIKISRKKELSFFYKIKKFVWLILSKYGKILPNGKYTIIFTNKIKNKFSNERSLEQIKKLVSATWYRIRIENHTKFKEFVSKDSYGEMTEYKFFFIRVDQTLEPM